ncbi:hypothetical protein [Psychrobacter urativorans]|uniref:hypothetical protein n=1 Tax=Psychrobacter urativorans TaxID=45610 RepID=UPI001917E95C|nr:hypothetical protein [Psychrobacter urativorans]
MTALTRLKNDEVGRFDYPEAFVLILTVGLIGLHFEFSPTFMALLVIVCLPSLMILIYNYRWQPSFGHQTLWSFYCP